MGKAQQLGRVAPMFSILAEATRPAHPRLLLITPGPWTRAGLSRLLDHHLMGQPTALWLFQSVFSSFATQASGSGKKAGCATLPPLAPIKCLNNWPNLGFSGGPFIPVL